MGYCEGQHSFYGRSLVVTPMLWSCCKTDKQQTPHTLWSSAERLDKCLTPIKQNETASETTYTIFCPTAAQVACDLSLEFPFIIVEGPSTLKFHGTLTST